MTSPIDYRLPDDAESSQEALTVQRVADSLSRQGYSYVEDEEHADMLRARFDAYPFLFILTGEQSTALQVRARWNHSLDISRKVEMLKICNEWNMNRIWPKCYVRREAETVLGLYGELAVDFGAGVADDQIDRAITCGLQTIISFFREVEDRVGDSLDEIGA